MDVHIIAPTCAAHHFTEDGWQVWELRTLTPVSQAPLNPSDADLHARTGHWARIESDGQQVRLYSDRLLSFPLYYARGPQGWVAGTDVYQVAQAAGCAARSGAAARELLNCAHTLGDETLFEGVFALPAASQVILTAEGATSRCWGAPNYPVDAVSDPAQFGEHFDAALTAALARAVENLQGQQIVIPLSGGIDSRLLVMYLRKVGAKNLVAFTYGKPGSREVATSAAVAKQMGIDWHGVELDPAQMRAAWSTPEAAAFRRATWSGFALPHVQDWWALRQLRAEGVLRPGDVVFPGHTIVGNMHHPEVLESPSQRAKIAQAVAAHHWCLRSSAPRSAQDWELIRTALAETMRETQWQVQPGDEGVAARRQTQSLVEWFNLKHRQAKYINNSIRAYEFFDLNWALPMLDAQMWQVWFSGSEDLTVERDWYRAFTDALWAEHTGEQLRYFEPANVAMSARVKTALLTAMRATKADRALSKARSVRTQLDHPMAFEAFASGMAAPQLGWELLRGRTQMGVWTQLFLDNRWGGDEPIVP